MSTGRFSSNGGNFYENASAAESGMAGNNYAPAHELSQLDANPNSQSQTLNPPSVLSQPDFLTRVDYIKSEIRTLTSNIQDISALHQRALSSPDSSSSGQLEDVVSRTQLKNTQIRDQIKFLEGDAAKTQDGSRSVKLRQTKQIKGEFEKVLNNYRQEELTYQKRYREQIARQYRIVNPDATEAEVEEATSLDWGSEGVFQSVLKGNRSGQATTVLGAVRARHNELQRIEATLTDLASLFAEMAQIVDTQDPIIENTEQNAMQANDHVEKANVQIDAAKKNAARARKLKWLCALVGVLILLAIALGLGLGYGLVKSTSKPVQDRN